MPNRFGGAIANAMGAIAKVLGYGIYYLLRVIYRPRDRMIALAGAAALAVIIAALVYFL
ncbi:hypothetical protein [Sphingomonas soli]|uniref:hypothetical protein n=1 Tax=Sphingomonas soli TaxID=266127 RepID=UPI000A7F9825|nr:hypothetical protein [Sphingomonas soli]